MLGDGSNFIRVILEKNGLDEFKEAKTTFFKYFKLANNFWILLNA